MKHLDSRILNLNLNWLALLLLCFLNVLLSDSRTLSQFSVGLNEADLALEDLAWVLFVDHLWVNL